MDSLHDPHGSSRDEQSATEVYIRDAIIISSPHEEVRKAAFNKKDLTLKDLLEITDTFESKREAMKIITSGNSAPFSDSEVKAVSTWPRKQRQSKSRRSTESPKRWKRRCFRCDREHGDVSKCGAKSMKCFRCNKMGHLARCCKESKDVNQIVLNSDYNSGTMLRCIRRSRGNQRAEMLAHQSNLKEAV
ncbi:hypothetical protein ACOME3_007930 [Neoechinorhynchus agilis]